MSPELGLSIFGGARANALRDLPIHGDAWNWDAWRIFPGEFTDLLRALFRVAVENQLAVCERKSLPLRA
jgi:hypothetical protein